MPAAVRATRTASTIAVFLRLNVAGHLPSAPDQCHRRVERVKLLSLIQAIDACRSRASRSSSMALSAFAPSGDRHAGAPSPVPRLAVWGRLLRGWPGASTRRSGLPRGVKAVSDASWQGNGLTAVHHEAAAFVPYEEGDLIDNPGVLFQREALGCVDLHLQHWDTPSGGCLPPTGRSRVVPTARRQPRPIGSDVLNLSRRSSVRYPFPQVPTD